MTPSGSGLLISPLPISAESVPFGGAWLADRSLGVDLAQHGYVEQEFLVSGTASVWTYDDTLSPVVATPDVPFTTRVLVRRPVDAAHSSGVVQVEALHPDLDSGFIWGAVAPWLMRSGHTWMGVTAFSSSEGVLRESVSGARYSEVSLPLEGLQYDIVGAVASALRAGDFDRVVSRRILLAGWSATGSFCRVFVQDGFADRWRNQRGEPPFDGYVICISSGGAGASGYPPLSPECAPLPFDDVRRTILPHDVPVFEVLSEMESETNYAVERDDSDGPNDRYRLYQLAGTSHITQGRDILTNRAQYEAGGGRRFRLAVLEERSDARFDLLAAACFEAMVEWIRDGIPAPHGGRFSFAEQPIGFPPGRFGTAGLPPVEGRELVRDSDGNVVGGVRSPWVTVPTGAYFPHSTPAPDADRPPEWMPFSRPEMMAMLMGSRVPFSAAEVRRRYGTIEDYLGLFAAATDALVAERLLLRPEADELLGDAPSRWSDSQIR